MLPCSGSSEDLTDCLVMMFFFDDASGSGAAGEPTPVTLGHGSNVQSRSAYQSSTL